MRRTASCPTGPVTRLAIDCPRLSHNMLGDPTRRAVDVWVPHGHGSEGLPLLVALAGFMSGGLAHTNWRAFGENVPERLDRLVHDGWMKPCVVAFPDCFTRLGGNQYINSHAMGPWMDAICDDLVPRVEAAFGCGGPGRRAVFGKSSGGYGALMHAMLRPDVWAAAACHSGDMGFELCYLPEMPATLRGLARHGGSPLAFVEALEARRSRGKGEGKDGHVLMMLAMAATYDPDPDADLGIRLPVTDDTCELIPERWARWTGWDPITRAPSCLEALRGLKLLFLDCGDSDQYNLLYGVRRLRRLLADAGVAVRYVEFADDHSGIDYRLDESLPALADAVT